MWCIVTLISAPSGQPGLSVGLIRPEGGLLRHRIQYLRRRQNHVAVHLLSFSNLLHHSRTPFHRDHRIAATHLPLNLPPADYGNAYGARFLGPLFDV